MEIERKFTIKELPDLSQYSFHKIEQAYLNTDPVIRIRREDDNYYMTYKGKGLLAREEYNLPLNKESYFHLLSKADGIVISKTRYLIPYKTYTIELDLFEDALAPLIIAEVEFVSEEEAHDFPVPDWFLQDVTMDSRYHNSNLSKRCPNL
ncbi:MAG: CYTH domain-containing protein [Lachnospiraceae bacterium]